LASPWCVFHPPDLFYIPLHLSPLHFGFYSFTGFTQKNIGRAIKYIAASFSTEFEMKQLRDFEMEHAAELGTSTRAVQQAIEAGEANLMWMEKNYESIWRWLKIQNTKLY